MRRDVIRDAPFRKIFAAPPLHCATKYGAAMSATMQPCIESTSWSIAAKCAAIAMFLQVARWHVFRCSCKANDFALLG